MKVKNAFLVFGSNRLGRHGKGAAMEAVKHFGAIEGVGEGIQGQSYAIPTKKTAYKFMSLPEVKEGVDRFLDYARQVPEMYFFVTRIGCGLAGFTDDEIGPMFALAPKNCILPNQWRQWRIGGGPSHFIGDTERCLEYELRCGLCLAQVASCRCLPLDKTCADCSHFQDCRFTIARYGGSQQCEWEPNRFDDSKP